jgi:adenylosuccinate synthase
MPVTVIVGGQYGSEGKGKIAAFLARPGDHSVRTGGPNAGHTIIEDGKETVVRHLPSSVVRSGVKLYLGAGAIIDRAILLDEIAAHGIEAERLTIDPQAVVISASYAPAESDLVSRIGSTGKGVGAAVAAKVWRGDDVVLSRDVAELHPFLGDVAGALANALSAGERVVLEGTQGTGLSLHHGSYPYVTSRDVCAGSLCSEAGVGPTAVDRIVLVVRTFPIRVGGPSGPLANELTWAEVTKRSGYQAPLCEHTTVTGKVRRVGAFNLEQVVRAVQLNGATEIALTFADYLDASLRRAKDMRQLPRAVRQFITSLEEATGVPVTIVSTGPETTSTISLPS